MRKYPGSDIKNFKKVIGISEKLLNEVRGNNFFSPYSIVPIISQILGLNAPLIGGGHSLYSIVSIISKMNEKPLFQEAYKFSIAEKRLIIDEIYDMAAPLLLKEEDDYIDLLVNTRYENEFKGNDKKKLHDFKKTLKEKFSILGLFMSKFRYKKANFAHILHYGCIEDLYRECKFLKSLPHGATKRWLYSSYPIVNEILIKNFPDNASKTNNDIAGWAIFVANSTRQLLEDGKLRKRKILQGARLAEKLGAKIIGMGGLIASFAQGGHWLSEQIPNVGFTTGHAFTIANIVNIMEQAAKRVNLDVRKSIVAIVGAGGSIGSGCAELIARKHPKGLILIESANFISYKRLQETGQRIKRYRARSEIALSEKISDIRKADLIICATNSMRSIIKAEHLKPGAIVIDDSFPKNITKAILKKRKDVMLLEGGITRLPYSIDIYAARNMPDLMDAPIVRAFSCKEIYGCLAESLILSLTGHKGNYGLGYADTKLAKDIISKSKRFGISTAPLQCFDRAVEEERLQKVCRIQK